MVDACAALGVRPRLVVREEVTTGRAAAQSILRRLPRPGGPHALLTPLCLFDFDRERRRFRLRSVHPGHTLEEVLDQTGFAFDRPDRVPTTPRADAKTLDILYGPVREALSGGYPAFAATMQRLPA